LLESKTLQMLNVTLTNKVYYYDDNCDYD